MINEIYVNNIRVPNIINVTPGAEPTFGDGTGRNALDGHFSGTFVGYFTTLEISFGPCDKDTYAFIKSLLEHPFLNNVKYRIEEDLSWIDTSGEIHSLKVGDFHTEAFYNGAAIRAKQNYDLSVDEFSVTLTAVDRRPKLS